LGDLLVQAGVLSREQVDRALEYQRAMLGKAKLGEVLLEMRFVTEEAILRVLAEALHMPAADLVRARPTEEALATMDRLDAEKYLMMPLRIDASGSRKRLVVAVADPTNVEAIDNLQFRTGMVVQPLIATISQMRKALRQHYHWKGDSIDVSAAPAPGAGESSARVETWVGPSPLPSAGARQGLAERGEIVELKFYAGPLRGEVRRLGPGVSLVVGRGEDVDISIQDPRMSRRHLALVTREDGVEIVDIGSRNGTTVNQRPVRRASLKSGDFVQAGDTIIGITLLF
jgi:hypothetical protein